MPCFGPDVQPPVMTGCPVDRLVHVTELTRNVSWTAPGFSDPHGFNISVTSNYKESDYEFPWGEFVVQYSAVKPSNGMTAECNFTIAVKRRSHSLIRYYIYTINT